MTGPPPPEVPPRDVIAAIVAAVEVAWPRPAQPTDDDRNASRWRFSNRWWGRAGHHSGDHGAARRDDVAQRPRP